MTRFARADGSKASNKRIPEEATSWADMKQQLSDNKKSSRTTEGDANQNDKFKNSSKETMTKQTSEWCTFSDEEGKSKKKKNDGLSKIQNRQIVKNKSKKAKKQKVSLNQPNVSDTDCAKPSEEKIANKTDNSMNQNKQTDENNADMKKNIKSTQICYNKKGLPYKKKVAKKRDNQEHQRRKPNKEIEKIFSNGRYIEVIKYDGFPVMKEDFERLVTLRKSMISKGIPKSEVKATMLKERRRAEKAFAREKKKVCFQCRKSGHVLSECPELGHDQAGIQTSGTGMCFKCGSTEHTHFECKVVRSQEFKFAECFICKEKGHIARQCPDNPRGLYPKGGGCRECGSVTHLKKDCPKTQQENEEKTITLPTQSMSIEGLENDIKPANTLNKGKNIVKF